MRQLIAQGEEVGTEFKETFSDNTMETACAFANGLNGIPRGFIIFGVDDSGEILGLDNPDEIQQRAANVCRACEPPIAPAIESIAVHNKRLVVVRVEKSLARPHRARGVCYIRIGSTTRQATLAEENHIREETAFRPFDVTIVPNSTVQDLDLDKVMRYYRATRSLDVVDSETRNPAVLAEQLGVIRSEPGSSGATVAGIVMFGKNPQRSLPQSSINAIRFRGTSVSDPTLDRAELRGTGDELIEGATTFARRYSAIGSHIPGGEIRRVDISEYPSSAIREAVANAVVHRDYGDIGYQVDMYIFDDRIEVRSPGGLGGGLTLEDIVERRGQKRYVRNPNLASFLFELQLIEKAGTGIVRMFRVLEENGSPPPEFFADRTSVRVIIKAHRDYSARRKYEEGLLARDRGDVERARILFSEALEIKPNYADAMAALANLEGSAGATERSRDLYSRALASDPYNLGAILAWAEQEDRLGNVSEARRLYERATNVAPNSAMAWHTWATMERRLGHRPKARELFLRAVELAPENSANWQALGQLEIRAGNYPQARVRLEKALTLARDDYTKAWILADLAFALLRLRVPKDEVDRRYKESLALNPDSPQTCHAYGVFLRNMGRAFDAERYFSKARMLGWRDRAGW